MTTEAKEQATQAEGKERTSKLVWDATIPGHDIEDVNGARKLAVAASVTFSWVDINGATLTRTVDVPNLSWAWCKPLNGHEAEHSPSDAIESLMNYVYREQFHDADAFDVAWQEPKESAQ